MAYDWNNEANKVSAKLGRGAHHVTVTRVLRGGKGGATFSSRAGDPQLMVIMANDAGAEVSSMFTLSDKAGWTLARFLSRAGVDTAQLMRDNIEPKHFANETIAKQWLVNRKLWVHVEYETGNDGKRYSRVEPLTAEEASAVPTEPLNEPPRRARAPVAVGADPFADPAPDEEDIPF